MDWSTVEDVVRATILECLEGHDYGDEWEIDRGTVYIMAGKITEELYLRGMLADKD